MKPYADASYAATRLNNTIVRLGGKPIYIEAVGSAGTVSFWYLRDHIAGTCRLKDLDINPVPLGYMNIKTVAIYTCRMPMREDWRQGLRDNNFRRIDGTKVGNTNDWVALADTIEGIYPSLTDCVKALNDKKATVRAFSRNFAINSEGQLLFKEKFIVGELFSEKKLKLSDAFTWLNSLFEDEVLNGNFGPAT